MSRPPPPTSPGRLLQLWRLQSRMDFLWLARDWHTTATWYAADVVVNLGVVVTALLLSERFDGIGAWSRPEVRFLLGYALVVRGLLDTVCGYNLSFISRRIGRGQLDHMLVQPQPLWMIVLSEGFSPWSGSGTLLAGAALLGFAVAGGEVTVAWAWLPLQVVGSALLLLAFAYAWGSAAFWAPKAAEEINSSSMLLMDELRGFPLDGVPAALRLGLLSVVPVGFVAWWPSAALLDPEATLLVRVAAPIFSLLFGALALAIFRRGLRHYARTGSTRYLAHGHRS